METKRQRIEELVNFITHHQTIYYTGEAEISDSEFDMLWDELKILDPENPVLQKIGSDIPSINSMDNDVAPSGGIFEKAKHIIPMGSQEKAANAEEFDAWAQKMPFDDFIVEHKLDGASLELQYERGNFLRAVTRGDGETGDDISRNVIKMRGFIKTLNIPFSGGVRAEVIMTHEVHKNFYSDKANCRNAANGLMKRKDGIGSEHLLIMCYDAWAFNSDFQNIKQEDFSLFSQPFGNEAEKIQWLALQGFITVPFETCKGSQSVIDYREKLTAMRANLDYDIDGLVVKGFSVDYEDAKRTRPEKQIAFKFSLEEAITVLRSVIWNESGATYTPIAEFDTVELAGTRVQRASLVNPNTVRALGVCIGSRISVTKRGEIIPKIERVIVDNDTETVCTSPVVFPTQCETCQTELRDEGTRLYCPNAACSKRLHHRIEKWVNVLDIRDFGVTLIKRLYEIKRLASISDIYTLKEEELAELDGLGAKSAKKIIASIQSRRTITLAQFIAGFDIENIGETLAEKLIEAGFTDLSALLNAGEDDIARVPGFAKITAGILCRGLEECRHEMLFLTENNIINIKTITNDALLAGKTFCFTGELHTMKRSEAEKAVKQAGGSVKSSVGKGLSFLVTNDVSSQSAKNKKAHELGIPIINEEEFLDIAQVNR